METGGKGPNFDFLIEMKLMPFMVLLHALRYPNKHEAWFYADGYVGLAAKGWHQTAEYAIIDPNATPREKALHIREQFRPIGLEISARTEPGSRYSSLLEYCEANQHKWRDTDIVDAEGNPVSSQELLPPEDIVEEMFVDWVDNDSLSCTAMEDYIRSVWHSHGNLPPIPTAPPSIRHLRSG